MALPSNLNLQALTTAVRTEMLNTYQHGTLLSLFPSEQIPDGIANEEWALRYIKETQRAALTRRGYNPNSITMDFNGYSLKPMTVSQEMKLTEIDLAQFAKNGLLPKTVPEMAKNISYTTNTAIMNGKGGNGEAMPFTQYNYIIEAGSGNGTADRPNPMYDTSGGAWNTHATMRANIAAWIGTYGAKGGNIGNSVVLAPRVTMPTLKEIKSEYNDHNVEFYLKETGIRDIVYIDDEFFATIVDGTTLATAALFDLIVIDPSEFVVGYQRPETVTQGPTPFPGREYVIQMEVWFCLLPIPTRKNEAGTIKTYKHMGRCKDITTA
jgi:hypothetical protein